VLSQESVGADHTEDISKGWKCYNHEKGSKYGPKHRSGKYVLFGRVEYAVYYGVYKQE
jgi:hypothetical protein